MHEGALFNFNGFFTQHFFKLFHAAVDNGWVMTELYSSVLSLEQVFLQLTMGEKRS